MSRDPLFKTAMRFGAYSGLSIFIIFLLVYFAGKNPFTSGLMWLGTAVFIAFMSYGMRFYRDDISGGSMTYWRGVLAGTLISIAGYAAFSVLVYVFIVAVDPSLLERYKTEALDALEQSRDMIEGKVSGNSIGKYIDKAAGEIDKLTAGTLAFSDFLNKVTGGFIFSLILSAILRKSKPLFDQQG